jgi:methionyl-tRNA formyltransferase
MHIFTADGYLDIKSLQMPGKRKMETQQLLNGMVFSDSSMAK